MSAELVEADATQAAGDPAALDHVVAGSVRLPVDPDVAHPPFEVVAHGRRTDESVAPIGLDQEPGRLALGGSTCAVDRP